MQVLLLYTRSINHIAHTNAHFFFFLFSFFANSGIIIRIIEQLLVLSLPRSRTQLRFSYFYFVLGYNRICFLSLRPDSTLFFGCCCCCCFFVCAYFLCCVFVLCVCVRYRFAETKVHSNAFRSFLVPFVFLSFVCAIAIYYI